MIQRKCCFKFFIFIITSLNTWLYTTTYAQTTGPEKGSLLICGGGALGPEIWEKFIALAGGTSANIVVIPTALGDDISGGNQTVQMLKKMGVPNVILLHTSSPTEANQSSFYQPLLQATGVWFSGGRQWRLVDAYGGTGTQVEIEKVLERGGVIGGSSAGATIQGSFMVRGDTKGNTLMIGDHTTGFGYLKNAAIDQHVLRRNRQFDMTPVIEKFPALLGIGIDEKTGIIVQKDTFEVIGASYVAIHDAQDWKEQTAKSGTIKSPFYFLSSGQKFNLLARKILTEPKTND